MKIKFLSRILFIFTFFILLLTTTGVYATFRYSTLPPYDEKCTINVNMADFKWEGSDVLPDDVQGEDHAWLIQNLVDGEGIGLNTRNSYLNARIEDRLDGGLGWKRDYFGSMAVTGGSEVEQIFGTEAEGLSFIVHVIDDLNYYIYTTSVYLGERGEPNWLNTGNKTPGKPTIPLGEYVYAVYRTLITRANTSSKWQIIATKEGKAKSAWYEENRRNSTITQIPSFSPSSWVETSTMGSEPTVENAILTFKGDSRVMYSATTTEGKYYRIKLTSAQSVTITTYNLKGNIKVYNSGNGLIAQSSLTTDSNGTECMKVTFNASANSNYYFFINGDRKVQFNVA